jgi:ABC-type glutathione transport system ATPase component
MTASDALLRVQGLAVHDAHGQALVRELSFTLREGEVLTLLGESGSGKSLLAQAVMGALPQGLRGSGQVQLRGGLHWGRRVALLPQEPGSALSPLMAAERQVAEVHHLVAGRDAPAALRQARLDLQALGLAAATGKRPFELSGGVAQRVAFAASRAGGAPLLLADEPTKGLDAAMCGQVVALLRRHVAAGGALLVITHDIVVARALGGRVAVMQAAEWLEQGEAGQVLQRPQHPYTQALLAAEPARWPRRPGPAPAGAPLLQARGLAVSFGAPAVPGPGPRPARRPAPGPDRAQRLRQDDPGQRAAGPAASRPGHGAAPPRAGAHRVPEAVPGPAGRLCTAGAAGHRV